MKSLVGRHVILAWDNTCVVFASFLFYKDLQDEISLDKALHLNSLGCLQNSHLSVYKCNNADQKIYFYHTRCGDFCFPSTTR